MDNLLNFHNHETKCFFSNKKFIFYYRTISLPLRRVSTNYTIYMNFSNFYRSIAQKIFIMILLFTVSVSYSQTRMQRFTEEEKNWSEYNLTGWRFGINMGMYMAGKSTAGFYSGMPENENNIAWLLNNYYFYQDILQELNSRNILRYPSEIPPQWAGAWNEWRAIYNVLPADTTKWWIYYPENLKYNTSMSVGFYVKYNFNNTTGIFLQSNYVKLKTSGIFQMVIDSITGFSEPALREGYLRGEEERINIDIGISKFYRTGRITSVFVETGLHLNSTQALSNDIMIGNKEFSIVNRYLNQNWVPNTNITEYNIYQGGIGFGIFLNSGIKFILNEDISIDPGVQFYYNNIKLNDYADFTLNYNFYIRMIFSLFADI
ncbi:MAG TPA: hypothetical protein PK915_06500 [Bacteroidales bacterium]|nr:hypothetical protein [Bacteroidales bacterium]